MPPISTRMLLALFPAAVVVQSLKHAAGFGGLPLNFH
jgi:hypothetical protein